MEAAVAEAFDASLGRVWRQPWAEREEPADSMPMDFVKRQTANLTGQIQGREAARKNVLGLDDVTNRGGRHRARRGGSEREAGASFRSGPRADDRDSMAETWLRSTVRRGCEPFCEVSRRDRGGRTSATVLPAGEGP